MITKVIPRQILDSRGNPTVEVEIELADGSQHRASVPSGASTGIKEAIELRSVNMPNYYNGKSIAIAIANIDVMITPYILGKDPRELDDIENYLKDFDGTDNYAKIGANATLAVTIALTKAAAYLENLEVYQYINQRLRKDEVPMPTAMTFPTPMFNIINGGAHAANNIAIQEFMVVPIGIKDIREKIRAGAEILYALKDLLKEKGLASGVGDEGGYAPNLPSDQDALDLIMQAIKRAKYKPDSQIKIALDVAASQYYDTKTKIYKLPHQKINNKVMTIEGDHKIIIAHYANLCDKYPILSIEDGLHEEDWRGFGALKLILDAKKVLCVGDDLTVTNQIYIKQGIDLNAISGVIIKPNQVGTVLSTLRSISLAKKNNITIIASHRSGDTADTFISHLAVGAQAEFIKAGAPQRAERVEKYNELLRMIKTPKAQVTAK